MPSATVTDSNQLRNAIQLAEPGDIITLSGAGPFSVGTLAKLTSTTLTTNPGGDYQIVGDGTPGQTITNTRIYQENIDGSNAPSLVKDLTLNYTSGNLAILRATQGSYTVDNVSFTGTHTGWAGNGNNYIVLTVSNPLTGNTSTNDSTLVFKDSDVSINGTPGNGFNGTSGGASFIQSWNNEGGVTLTGNTFDESGYLAAFQFFNSPSATNILGLYAISNNTFNRTTNNTIRSRGERLENVGATLSGNTFNDGSYLHLNGNTSGVVIDNLTGVNTFNTIAGGYGIRAERQGTSGSLLTGTPMFFGTTVFNGPGLPLKYSSPTVSGSISYSGGVFNVGGVSFDRLSAGSQVADNISLGTSPINDWVNGDDGNDTINAGGGNDFILGGDGNDSLTGGIGDDTINGGVGIDTISYTGTTAVTVNLATGTATGVGNDIISNIENVIGSDGADTITGDNNANFIDGGSGSDTIDGGLGDDTILGGGVGDRLLGGDGNDSIDGGIGNDIIFGGNGNDTILGGNNNDTIDGGVGIDILSGGSNNDSFVYNLTTEGQDIITDFTPTGANQDTLRFNGSAFGLFSANPLNINNFQSGAGLTSATTPAGTPTFVFNTTTSTLIFDNNGSTAGGTTSMAVLTGVTTLSNTNIVIF